MTPGGSVRVRGADTVARTMRAAADDLADLSATHQEVGSLVARAAQANAPRKTGRLSASIRAATVSDGVAITAGGSLVPYAGPQEGGWRRRGIRPRLYMRRALEANQSRIVDTYVTAVDDATGQIRGV